MRTDLPSGTVTLLFTDIEGSTRLLHALGPEAYAEALAEHRRLLRDAFGAHAGVEVDTQGDAFFVSFPTAPGAVAAALEAQEALAPGPIRVRMGLHTGSPTLTAEGYVGADVHRGARVAALAHGGQVILTESTRALLPESVVTVDLGLHRVKDFDAPARLLQLGSKAFPPLRTPGATDLPTPATRFVGRERELFDAVTLWLDHEPRVLTVIGTGGAGKTRFALELARLLAEDADGGTVFVPLTSVQDPRLVLPAIAERLGASGSELDAIAARAGERRVHVLLDNLEHLLPAVAADLARLVGAAPTLRVLATSRELLRIGGEVAFDLPPLDERDAVALFLERARAARPGLESDPTVVELVRRLDGLPLALELAAARVRLLSPAQLLERLSERLDFLRGGRDTDERHATLRATIAWSHDLLESGEQELFARLAVFRSGCTVEQAETVCDADLDALASLLDKSLLRQRVDRDGHERLWMLELIREFARDRLHLAGDEDLWLRRHAVAMREIARAANLNAEASGPHRYPTVLSVQDDLRAAIDWASERDPLLALEIAVALENFWATRGGEEGSDRLSLLLERDPGTDAALTTTALRVHGSALDMAGRPDEAERRYRQSYEAALALGDELRVAIAEHRIATHEARRGDTAGAERRLEEALASAHALAFPKLEAQILGSLGLLRSSRDPDAAAVLLRRSAELAATVGFTWWQGTMLLDLAELELGQALLEDAERSARSALQVLASIDDRHRTGESLVLLARVASARGDHVRAGLLLGAAEAEVDVTRVARDVYEVEQLASERDPAFLTARERGRQLGLEEAVAVALGIAGQTEP